MTSLSLSHSARVYKMRVWHFVILALALLVMYEPCAIAATPMISGGKDNTAWLKSDGTVWTMGTNQSCVLGIGSTGPGYTYRARPVQVLTAAATPLTNIVKIDMGQQGLLAVDGSGRAWQTGGSCYATKVVADASSNPLTGVVDVAAGWNCKLYLLSNGQAMQQGTSCVTGPSGTYIWYPAVITDQGGVPFSGIVDLHSSKSPWPSSSLVLSNGELWSWGSNNSSKLGVGTAASRVDWPRQAVISGSVPLTGVVQVAQSMWGTWARKTDGSLWSTGEYDSNSINTPACTCFGRVETSPGVNFTGAVQLDAGSQSHFVARRSDGTAWGAGYSLGQFNDGTMDSRNWISQMGSGTTWVDVAAGRATTHLLRSDGTLWAGGWNQSGELGVCDMVPRTTFVQVTTCISPYIPWKPRDFAFFNADGSSSRFNGGVQWVQSGVTDSMRVDFETGDEDPTDTLVPRYQFTAMTNPGFVVADPCTAGTALPPVATTSDTPKTVSKNETGLTHGTTYKVRACMIDAFGGVSGWGFTDEWWVGATISDNSVRVDAIRPANPTSIFDGSSSDIDWQTSTTTLAATFAATDDLSGIWGANACVSTSPTGADCGGTPVKTWASYMGTTFTISGLSLVSGTRYYVCAKSEDYARNTSTGFLCTDGVTVDDVPPTNPTVRNDGTGADVDILTSSSTLDGNWNAGSDAQSGLQNYDYCFTTSSTGANCATGAQKTWTTTTGLTGSATGLTLVHGTTYYVCIRARDNLGNVATASCSNGAVFDVNLPTTTLVSPANSASLQPLAPTLIAGHGDTDGDTGTITFEVCDDSVCTSVVRSGSSTAGIASGANGSWKVTASLALGTQYWWRARSTDQYDAVGAWSAAWTFTTTSIPPLEVTGATPATVPQGRKDVIVHVNGNGFQSGATVAIAGSGVTITNTTWVSASVIDVTLDIAGGATISARDVTVTNPDLSTATDISGLAIVAPSISVGISTLGFADAARDPVGPHTIQFSTLLPGDIRKIGTVSSGQTLAGAAIELTVSSDTDWLVQVNSTDWSDGATGTMAAAQLEWKHDSVVEPWTGLTTSPATSDGPIAPGSQAIAHDLRLTIPPNQPAGTYSGSITYTVVAAP